MSNQSFPEKVKKALEEKGLKQKFVAQNIGISESYLSNIIADNVKVTDKIKEKLVEFLNIK